MLLRHLRYLVAVVEHGGFTRAAEALHVSQPTLSQQVQQLEQGLGFNLLDRTGRIVRATDEGEASDARSSVPRPSDTAAPQLRQPSAIPIDAQRAAFRPSAAVVLRTIAVSTPGVTVRTDAAARNARRRRGRSTMCLPYHLQPPRCALSSDQCVEHECMKRE
jgi:hypothetical protein